MIVDVHAHVIVPEITRAADQADTWRPAVRRDAGAQVVEFGGRSIRSAVGEFVDADRILAEAAATGVDRLVLSPWVNLLPYDLDLAAAVRACRVQNDALAAIRAAHPDRVAALAAFHPGGLATDAPDSPHRSAGELEADVYLGFADEDPSMTREQIATVERALREAGVRYRAEVYEEARHGYTMADGPAFDEAARERHFRELRDLLARTL